MKVYSKKIRKGNLKNFKLESIKVLKKPEHKNKTLFKNYKNYEVGYLFSKKKMIIFKMQRLEKIKPKELIKVYNDLIAIAKKRNVKEITANTWIFYQHPKLAEVLGFEMLKGTDVQIKKIMKKYSDHKIKGLTIENEHNKYQLVIADNKTKLEKKITISKLHLPMYVKKI